MADEDIGYYLPHIRDALEGIERDLRLLVRAVVVAGLGQGEKVGDKSRQELLEEVLGEAEHGTED